MTIDWIETAMLSWEVCAEHEVLASITPVYSIPSGTRWRVRWFTSKFGLPVNQRDYYDHPDDARKAAARRIEAAVQAHMDAEAQA